MPDEEGIIDPVTGAEIPRPEKVDAPTPEPKKERTHGDAIPDDGVVDKRSKGREVERGAK